ncbi:MAG: hypothetical protein H7125_12790 [Proteobacteria bacterium]|nr:hypothetical protein [Burkholderiales bacterium]
MTRATGATTVPARAISDHSGKAVAVVWFMAACFCAASVPLLWALADELAKGNRLVLIALVFPLTGVGLALHALRLTGARWRYGSLALHPDPDPGMVGGVLGGRIELPRRVETERDVELVLTCWRTTISQRSDNDGTHTERDASVVWQREGRPVVRGNGPGSMLLFRFAVPPELPPTDDNTSCDGAHRWTLSVRIDAPGLRLTRQFEVPIARHGEVPSPEIARLPEESRHGVPPQVPAKAVEITRGEGAMQFRYPPLRNRGLSITCLLFASIFIGSVWLMSATTGVTTSTIAGVTRTTTGAAPWFLIVVFALLGAALLMLAAFLILNTLIVRIDNASLFSRRSVLGIALWERKLPRADIGDIQAEISMTRKGARPSVVYRLWALNIERVHLSASAAPIEAMHQSSQEVIPVRRVYLAPNALPIEKMHLSASEVLQARRAGTAVRKRVLVGVGLEGSALAERVRGELKRALGLG